MTVYIVILMFDSELRNCNFHVSQLFTLRKTAGDAASVVGDVPGGGQRIYIL
jgi:hypothetical protein